MGTMQIFRFLCFIRIARVIVMVVVTQQAANAAVVYDSLSGSLFTGGRGFSDSLDNGQSVTLSGVERKVTQFEVYLGSAQSDEFYVRFYELDGAGGEPGTLVWQSPAQTYPSNSPFFQRKIVTVSVPGIIIPNTFVWAIAPVGANNFLVGNADLPTVGVNHEIWKHRSIDGTWTSDIILDFGFGARITAVPEPSSVILFILAVVCGLLDRRGLAWRRRA